MVELYFEISLLSFIHKIFEQNFYLYITVYLVRIWTYKNADEKAPTLSRRSKHIKKRTKTYEKRILCKFTLRQREMNKNMALRSSKFNVLKMYCFAPSVFVLTPRHLITLKFYFMFQRNCNVITSIIIKKAKYNK